ncbi:hypothetical protein PAPYR_3005 [Paratrimastix pyriformis]|uniref:Uncharacterized protein n=1 Tax=Paratrimastix pyriformis TaxID=342808 RepID=A0ABQ8UNL0_9EUKA|nr:hypothetical protein PAPYR_3005 [Paratrimastix pyriformis]
MVQAYRDIMWSIRNIALSCLPTAEGMRIRATGWYNIQLQVIPPPGLRITRVKYVFHPAFNVASLTMNREPYDLLVKLCSTNVFVLIEIHFGEGQTFTIAHRLEKEPCTRNYFYGDYNGLMMGEDEELPNPEILAQNIDVKDYFKQLLALYRRPDNYYSSPIMGPRSPSHPDGGHVPHYYPANVTPGTPIPTINLRQQANPLLHRPLLNQEVKHPQHSLPLHREARSCPGHPMMTSAGGVGALDAGSLLSGAAAGASQGRQDPLLHRLWSALFRPRRGPMPSHLSTSETAAERASSTPPNTPSLPPSGNPPNPPPAE